MAIYVEPHTEEWFAALAAFNAAQAVHTKGIVDAAGRRNVCSVCGDDPASDYQLGAKGLPERAVATLRLCDDCQEIRSMQGEVFLRWP